MIALAAITLLMASQEPPLPPMTEEEVLIIAPKLNRIAVSITRKRGDQYDCSLSDTTGVDALDAALCRTAVGCVRHGNKTDTAIKGCVARARPALVAQLRKHLKGREQ
jgi:hypothetical protein